jgi:hypothetical protein
MKGKSKNSSIEGQKHPYLRDSFWLIEYQKRINSPMFPEYVKERYKKAWNKIMTEQKNLSIIDPTLLS